MLQRENHYIQINEQDQLHLMRIYENDQGPPVFLLHGAIENGQIFYSKNNKGLAPFLAEQGYDVYVADLRGRGLSQPLINRHSNFSQTEAITEDIPAFISYIRKLRGDVPQYWMAHSWGGVLLSAYFARFPEHRSLVKGMVYFASKRCVRVKNKYRYFMIDFIWKFFATLLAAIYGYLPAKKWRFGSDNETKKSHQQGVAWVRPSPWIDPQDAFDYGSEIKKLNLPAILYLTGLNDHCLGHARDVQDFIKESGSIEKAKFVLLAKKNGNLKDYDHINILTDPNANLDQFKLVLDWLHSIN